MGNGKIIGAGAIKGETEELKALFSLSYRLECVVSPLRRYNAQFQCPLGLDTPSIRRQP
jgi:hypothetical protein